MLLLPLAEALPHTAEHFVRTNIYARARRSVPVVDAIRRAVPNVMPYYYGFSGKGMVIEGYHEPTAYAGSVLLPFAALGLLSRRREKWPLLIIGILGIAVGARLWGVMDALCALPGFDIGINERMVFLGAFATAALAALGMERLRDEGGVRVLAGATAVLLALTAFLYVHAQPHVPQLQMPRGYFPYRMAVEALPLVLCAGLWLALRGRGREITCMAAAVLLLVAQRGLEEGDFYPTYPDRAFYPPLKSLEPVPRKAPYRMTAVGFPRHISALVRPAAHLVQPGGRPDETLSLVLERALCPGAAGPPAAVGLEDPLQGGRRAVARESPGPAAGVRA